LTRLGRATCHIFGVRQTVPSQLALNFAASPGMNSPSQPAENAAKSATGRGATPLREFQVASDRAWALMRAAPGFLSEREGRFLALAAALAPAEGTILEIGSFKGKSTVGLASIARHFGLAPIVAVDPFTAPSTTDPDLSGAASSLGDFRNTIAAADLVDHVEVHEAFSSDLAIGWNRPIRFLWIDGDHTYRGTKTDIDLFREHLRDGAIVALHDALHDYEGPIRVFVEDVLGSDDFAACGFVGSIAWAQFRPGAGATPRFRQSRLALARKAQKLIPFVRNGATPAGLNRLRYRFWRSLVPHGPVDPREWSNLVLE
jgi:predicted O-methyltransferase YrrM